MTLIEQTKSTAQRLIDLLDQIEHREASMEPDTTARLENIREAKINAQECLEAVELL